MDLVVSEAVNHRMDLVVPEAAIHRMDLVMSKAVEPSVPPDVLEHKFTQSLRIIQVQHTIKIIS